MNWDEIQEIENIEIIVHIIEALFTLSEISNISFYELTRKFTVNPNQRENEKRDKKILFNIYQEIQK